MVPCIMFGSHGSLDFSCFRKGRKTGSLMTTVQSSNPEVSKLCADLLEIFEESTVRESLKRISLTSQGKLAELPQQVSEDQLLSSG